MPLNQLKNYLVVNNHDAVLITSQYNRRYFSGFTGSSAYLLVSKDAAFLLTDFRYIEQAQAQALGYEVIDYTKSGLMDTIDRMMIQNDLEEICYEDLHMTVSDYSNYTAELAAYNFYPLGDALENIRKIKNDNELKQLATAAKIADKAFAHILTFIQAGMTERDVALELEFYMKKQGASDLSFETIVASGLRSSLPHGVASDKVIEEGDFVTMDFGCIYEGYCSDMTRTIVVGSASEDQKKVYNTVLAAQKAALEVIRAGKSGEDVDKVARDLIYEAGYEGYFGHGLGHSVGLEVHEMPRLSPKGTEILRPNMMATIEPGIYIPDFGGVRIEDLVVVTETGHRNLTSSPKELIEIK